jgi:hypothetical protein
LLFITFWTLCKRLTAAGARKSKMLKANGMKACWLSKYTFCDENKQSTAHLLDQRVNV